MSDLTTRCFEVGPTMTNCYVLAAGGACWVVDPGYGCGAVLDHLRSAHDAPECVVLTHGHCDHIAGVPDVRAAFPDVRVACPAGDAEMLTDANRNLSAMFGLPVTLDPPDEPFHPGDELVLGPTRWRVLDVAGHTPGGAALYCEAEGILLSGDALFAGSIGRTDFPGGEMDRLLANVREQLLTLPDRTRVLSGHGPETTIGAEKRTNPFVQEGRGRCG